MQYAGAEVYDEESAGRDVDSSERLTNGNNNAKGTHDKVYYGDQTSVSQQNNNNHQSNHKKVDPLGNKRSHGQLNS